MRYIIISVFAVFAVACSESPTGPSPILEDRPPVATTPAPSPSPSPSPSPTPTDRPYRWDRIGSGCYADGAPTPLPSLADAVVTPQEPGVVRATWHDYTTANGNNGLLFAYFVLEENEYRLCSWDMSDL